MRRHAALALLAAVAALAAGLHRVAVSFFEKSGGHELEVYMAGPGMVRAKLPASALFTDR